jgi:hypothetical protein
MKKIISLFVFVMVAASSFSEVISDIDFGMIYPKDGSGLYLIEYKAETEYYDGESDWSNQYAVYAVLNEGKAASYVFNSSDSKQIREIQVLQTNYDFPANNNFPDSKSKTDYRKTLDTTDYVINLDNGMNYILVESFAYFSDSFFHSTYDVVKTVTSDYSAKEKWNTSKLEKVDIMAYSAYEPLIATGLDFKLISTGKIDHNLYGLDSGRGSWARVDFTDTKFPENKWSIIGYEPNCILKKEDIEKIDIRAAADNLRLRSEDDLSANSLLTIQKNTRVKILETGKYEVIDGLLSNWAYVEVLSGSKDNKGNPIKDGTKGWCFGGYLKHALSFVDDPVLEEVFLKSIADGMAVYDYEHKAKKVVDEICKEMNISRLETYCFECKNWGYDEQTGYTMPNPLESAIENYWNVGFDYIVENYPQFINRATYSGKYDEIMSLPIIKAVQNDNMYALRKLLELGEDVNVSTNGWGQDCGLFSPMRGNLLTICNTDGVKKILLENGVETTYNSSLTCKCLFDKKGELKLYSKNDYDSDFVVYKKVDDKSMKTVEFSYEYAFTVNPREEDSLSGYVQTHRWIKVDTGTATGWVEPGLVFLPFYYFEP